MFNRINLYFSVKAWNEQRGNSHLLHRFITVAKRGVCEHTATPGQVTESEHTQYPRMIY